MTTIISVEAPKTNVIQSVRDETVLLVTTTETAVISVDSGGPGLATRPCITHLISADLTVLAGTTCLGSQTLIGDGVTVTVQDTGIFLEL